MTGINRDSVHGLPRY